MRAMLILFCCWLYSRCDALWAPFVKDHDAHFVRFVDFFKNPCGYCTAARMMFIGGGCVAVVLQAWGLGFLLLAAPLLLVLIERGAACAEQADNSGETQ